MSPVAGSAERSPLLASGATRDAGVTRTAELASLDRWVSSMGIGGASQALEAIQAGRRGRGCVFL